MRTTIHMGRRREFWRYAAGVREAQARLDLRLRDADEAAIVEAAPACCETRWRTGRSR